MLPSFGGELLGIRVKYSLQSQVLCIYLDDAEFQNVVDRGDVFETRVLAHTGRNFFAKCLRVEYIL